ncbi:hypothetical protein B1C81_16105 [Streptomyces sp. HG99]|nr:hypothetical protein B1C81_16105 [Streptomyces sp. HG99]
MIVWVWAHEGRASWQLGLVEANEQFQEALLPQSVAFAPVESSAPSPSLDQSVPNKSSFTRARQQLGAAPV